MYGNMKKNAETFRTSHLLGIFYCIIRLLKLNIKPVFVFDGKPPELKRFCRM